ncbi:Mitochondrial outer membrane protein iml2 [Lecanora helva]
MNDDLESAEAGLADGASSFHKMGKGMVAFLRATLGFEQEIMREASERLADAEATASADHRRAQRGDHSYKSQIYPPGAEYALCHVMTQLMSAVVGVLNESLTESVKGFYKLRKAYVTLSGILDAEARYMQKRAWLGNDTPSKQSMESLRSNRSARSMKGLPGGFGDEGANSASTSRPLRSKTEPLSHNEPMEDSETASATDDEDEFYDADETRKTPEKSATYSGHVEMNGVSGRLEGLSIDSGGTAKNSIKPAKSTIPPSHGLLDHDPDSDIFANPIDVFIHSGANLCFGLLLLMISMIPPAFGKLLFIIGFHGDKDRGIRMLWQATKFHNVNGAMAGLIVLGYYNGIMGFSDIFPDPDPSNPDENIATAYPRERCEALLADMRSRHPKSHLWLLEEARVQATNRRLATAISILNKPTKSPLKQVEAIEMFEKSLNAMYIHNYTLCAESFLACVTLNNWSHALYYYIAGAATVELYRQTKPTDPATATKHAKKATELLKLAPKHAGKKKFMARQLPFDIFVTRKIHKWETRATEWNIPFIDAVGVSPVEEMIFLWNGYKRMDHSQLETCLSRLDWSESTQNPHWAHEGADEKAILALLRGATLRNLGRWDDAKAAYNTLLSFDRTELKGGLRDNWTAPAAHYEMGVLCWMRRGEIVKEKRGGEKIEEEEEKWVRECEGWVEKAAKWEAYELDARIGLKIATAQDTLRRCGEKRGKGVVGKKG